MKRARLNIRSVKSGEIPPVVPLVVPVIPPHPIQQPAPPIPPEIPLVPPVDPAPSDQVNNPEIPLVPPVDPAPGDQVNNAPPPPPPPPPPPGRQPTTTAHASPSDVICADKSISLWYGQGGDHGLPQYIAIDRKPEFGCEILCAYLGANKQG
jgi:hypothetical protein